MTSDAPTQGLRTEAKAWAENQGLGELLTSHPQSNNYKAAFPTLMFSAGRVAGERGFSDDECHEWTRGVLDHISDRQAEDRRRKRSA